MQVMVSSIDDVFKFACTAVLMLSFGAVSLAESPEGRKAPPNFIFFITDDISPDDLSVYGNKVVKTPNLERIAKQGLVFDNAFLTISSCSPSRCSMITGRYPHNTGAPELHSPLPEEQTTFVQKLRSAGYHTVISGKNHMGKPDQLGFEVSSDSKPSGSERWTQHLRDRPTDKPFFAWFASNDAHYPFTLNDNSLTYDPQTITAPPMMFDGPRTREELAGHYHEVSRTDYYAGELIKELDRQQILDNTYLVYCSDNGRPFPRCKTYLYDSGIKTPLIIMGPGVTQGRSTSLVSSIDLSATFLELAGVEKPATIQGVSLTPILHDAKASVRDFVFAERNWHVYQNHQRAVRTEKWLYVWNAWPELYGLGAESSAFQFPAAKELWDAAHSGQLTEPQALLTKKPQPKEMLFQVQQDPHQFHNLSDEAEHRETLEQLRNVLERWKTETGDSVPTNPTLDRQDIHENIERSTPRGEFPGHSAGASKLNASGPIRF